MKKVFSSFMAMLILLLTLSTNVFASSSEVNSRNLLDYHNLVSKEEDDDRYIAVSTWGNRRSLNFNALWDGNLACGVLYFR